MSFSILQKRDKSMRDKIRDKSYSAKFRKQLVIVVLVVSVVLVNVVSVVLRNVVSDISKCSVCSVGH